MPTDVKKPSRRPPRKTFRTTSIVSAPGTAVMTAATSVNARTCESRRVIRPGQRKSSAAAVVQKRVLQDGGGGGDVEGCSGGVVEGVRVGRCPSGPVGGPRRPEFGGHVLRRYSSTGDRVTPFAHCRSLATDAGQEVRTDPRSGVAGLIPFVVGSDGGAAVAKDGGGRNGCAARRGSCGGGRGRSPSLARQGAPRLGRRGRAAGLSHGCSSASPLQGGRGLEGDGAWGSTAGRAGGQGGGFRGRGVGGWGGPRVGEVAQRRRERGRCAGSRRRSSGGAQAGQRSAGRSTE